MFTTQEGRPGSEDQEESTAPKLGRFVLLVVLTGPFAMAGMVSLGALGAVVYGVFPIIGMAGGVSMKQFCSVLAIAVGLSALMFLSAGMVGVGLLESAERLLNIGPNKLRDSTWPAGFWLSVIAPLVLVPANGILSSMGCSTRAKVRCLIIIVPVWGYALAVWRLLT